MVVTSVADLRPRRTWKGKVLLLVRRRRPVTESPLGRTQAILTESNLAASIFPRNWANFQNCSLVESRRLFTARHNLRESRNPMGTSSGRTAAPGEGMAGSPTVSNPAHPHGHPIWRSGRSAPLPYPPDGQFTITTWPIPPQAGAAVRCVQQPLLSLAISGTMRMGGLGIASFWDNSRRCLSSSALGCRRAAPSKPVGTG